MKGLGYPSTGTRVNSFQGSLKSSVVVCGLVGGRSKCKAVVKWSCAFQSMSCVIFNTSCFYQ